MKGPGKWGATLPLVKTGRDLVSVLVSLGCCFSGKGKKTEMTVGFLNRARNGEPPTWNSFNCFKGRAGSDSGRGGWGARP